MKAFLLAASALVTFAVPAAAQDTITSTSGSNSTAGAASNSGAASDQTQGQAQTQSFDGNVGRSDAQSNSNSNSGAVSGSDSTSASNQSQQQGQTAFNAQGVAVSNTFNSTNHKRSYIGTNTAVPLTASSSFSSDFCGSTMSGGGSAAPIGISLGLSGTKYDPTCRSLRVAEKAGMLAVSASNMGFKDMAGRLMAFSVWNICTANGPKGTDACSVLGLTGADVPIQTPPVNEPSSAGERGAVEKSRHDAQQASAAADIAATPTQASAALAPTISQAHR